MIAFRVFPLLLMLCFLPSPQASGQSAADDPPAAGTFRLTIGEGRFLLDARDAPLTEILRAVDAAIPGTIRASVPPERRITGRFDESTMESFLNALGIDYVLLYRRGAGGEPALEGAWVMRKGQDEAARETARAIRRWIRDLGDDTVRWNACRGMRALWEAGEAAIPSLENALRSDDYQTRQLAAEALWRMGDRYRPSARFLEVLVEGMRDDQYPQGDDAEGQTRYTSVWNAVRAYRFFEDPDRVRAAEPLLAAALNGDDPQQRFLSALILAEAGRTQYADRLARILAPHLADNQLSSDASAAAHALGRLGPAVRSQIAALVSSRDRQQAVLARLLLYHIDHPDAPPGVVDVPHFNSMVHDPVVEKSPVHFWGWKRENFPPHD